MTHINQRRDYAAVWTSTNPILMLGEVGWERDTRKAKLGDGTTPWNNLAYAIEPIGDRAPLNSPVFTGTPTAPTPAPGSSPLAVANMDAVRGVVTGVATALGNRSGSLNLAVAVDSIMNGVVSLTLTGNLTLDGATFPAAEAGYQFLMVVTQDGTGGRTITMPNIHKDGGALAISSGPNSISLLVFFYDGARWFAAVSGKGYAT